MQSVNQLRRICGQIMEFLDAHRESQHADTTGEMIESAYV